MAMMKTGLRKALGRRSPRTKIKTMKRISIRTIKIRKKMRSTKRK